MAKSDLARNDLNFSFSSIIYLVIGYGRNIIQQPKSHYANLPRNWALAKLKSVVDLFSGRDLAPNQYNSDGKGTPYITGASNISNGMINVNRWTEQPLTISSKDDVLITCKGTIGKIAFNDIGDIHIARQIMALRIKGGLNKEYLKFYLEYNLADIRQHNNGLIPGIGRSILLNIIIPVPPINEQNRIVSQIKVLYRMLDDIKLSLQ